MELSKLKNLNNFLDGIDISDWNGIAAQFEHFSHSCNVVALLNEILNSDYFLESIASKSYRHSNKFDKIVLAESQISGFRVTLHLWQPPYTSDELAEDRIHSHRFNFLSRILFGSLEVVNHSISNQLNGKEYFEYHYYPKGNSNNSQLIYFSKTLLKADNNVTHSKGELYYETTDKIHKVILPSDNSICTLVLRWKQVSEFTRVFNSNSLESEKDYSPISFTVSELKEKIKFIIDNTKNSTKNEKSFCFIMNNDKLLVGKTKGDNTFRLLGGNVDPNETSEEAIVREIKEEIHSDLVNLKYVGDVKWKDSICILYSANLQNSELTKLTSFKYVESDKMEYEATWLKVDDFLSNKFHLHPLDSVKSLKQYASR